MDWWYNFHSLHMETRWNMFVPRKVNIMIFHVLLDWIPTRCNLENKNMDVPSVLCLICELHIEQLCHLFVRREVTDKNLGCGILYLDIDWMDFDSVRELFNILDIVSLDLKKRGGGCNYVYLHSIHFGISEWCCL